MSTRWKRNSAIALAAAAAVLLFRVPAAPGHVDSPLLLEGCGSCHVGHGVSGEPMLDITEERFCYQCHGSAEKRSRMIALGKLSAAAVLKDVETEFQKTYRHPVVEGIGHSPHEDLPFLNGGTVNHAECVDCHNPHEKVGAAKTAIRKVKGYSLAGRRVESSAHEYEICFKCHSDRLILAEGERSLIDDFSIQARSQHPVTRPVSGTRPPSLLNPVGGDGTLDCSDCHRSGDTSASRGPHGSQYRYLLSGNYDTSVYTDESPFAFEFCYSCHDRSSILNDQSFPLHSEHLLGDPIAGRSGTSCYSCHVSHGSRNQPHLLEFNPQAVRPEDLTRRTEYRQMGAGSGECYLKCHGHNHGPGRY
jgi:predicted CXXCH cytochrome family protein